MKKKVIRINEQQLHHMISESVKKVLNEMYESSMGPEANEPYPDEEEFEKPMKTSYGLEFKTLNADEIDRFTGYDRHVAQCHIANCGRIIVDAKYEQPIDNEYDLEEIYEMLNA